MKNLPREKFNTINNFINNYIIENNNQNMNLYVQNHILLVELKVFVLTLMIITWFNILFILKMVR